uniref:Uncharacterized protein n=1 Tax=Rhodosorus marinus TaxID=101924 RepID=A0A7S2ZZ39_9RHOD
MRNMSKLTNGFVACFDCFRTAEPRAKYAQSLPVIAVAFNQSHRGLVKKTRESVCVAIRTAVPKFLNSAMRSSIIRKVATSSAHKPEAQGSRHTATTQPERSRSETSF